jgi:Fic family protein
MRFENFKSSFQILRLIGELDEFKGAWRSVANISPERLAALKHVATIESIGSSTRIEGASLSNSQVEALLSGLKTHSFRSRDEEEVAGYAELMKVVFENWQDIPLSENYIKQLHGILLQFSKKDDRHKGNYKTVPNHVQAIDEHGHVLGIVFKTANPFDTPFRMTELVNWTNEALQQGVIHPLLISAVFKVVFLAIHPFQDGNGRLSRGLTTLLLLKTGYAYVPYSSLESVIEGNKQSYYLALKKTQDTLDNANPDWEPWLLFFLQTLQKQKLRLQEKMERERIFQGEISVLGIKILDLIQERGNTQMAEIENITGESRSTIRLRLNELVKLGRLTRHGKGPATWYTLAK